MFRPPSEMESEELRQLTDSIVAALKTVYDPEIPADIYELGLIYNVDIDDGRFVSIEMTLTAPACPVAGEMPTWVENAVSAVPGVAGAKVNMVFDPPWDQTPYVRRSARRARHVVSGRSCAGSDAIHRPLLVIGRCLNDLGT